MDNKINEFLNEIKVGSTFGETRMNKSIDLGSYMISIQCSQSHYCLPRETIDFIDYTHMEVAAFYKSAFGDFVEIDAITSNEDIQNKFREYHDGSIYSFVPVELIENVYQDVKDKITKGE